MSYRSSSPDYGEIRTPSGLGHATSFADLQNGGFPGFRPSLSRRPSSISGPPSRPRSRRSHSLQMIPSSSIARATRDDGDLHTLNEDDTRSTVLSSSSGLSEIRTPSGLGHAKTFGEMQDRDTLERYERLMRRSSVSGSGSGSGSSVMRRSGSLRKPPPKESSLSSTMDLRGISEIPTPVGPKSMQAGQSLHRQPSSRCGVDPIILANVFPIVLSFCSKDDLTSAALVSRAFLDLARTALYRNLDLDSLDDDHDQMQLLTILSTRLDISSIVHTFSWLTISESKPKNQLLAPSLQNIHNLLSLSLRLDGDPSILYNVTAGLTSFKLLGSVSSIEASAHLSVFLAAQSKITSLILPDVFCLTLPSSMLSSPSLHTLPAPFLPLLTHLTSPTTLSTLLVPTRPLTSLSLQICTPIYEGLRPTSLMSTLSLSTSSVSKLELSMTSKIDARTSERVLMAAGLRLSGLRKLTVNWLLDAKVRMMRDATEAVLKLILDFLRPDSSYPTRIRSLSLLSPRSPHTAWCPSRT